MSHKPEGLCAVCGINTSQRCSACADYGFDLFLCGREHQKLVWYLHKRVCGENANPLTFPFLSSEEAADLKAHLDEPAMRSDPGGLTLKGHIERALFVVGQRVSLLDYIDSVTDDGQERKQHSQDTFPSLSFLRHSRAVQSLDMGFQALTDKDFQDPVQRAALLHRRDPYSIAATFFGQLMKRIPTKPHEGIKRTFSVKVDGYTSLLHHVAVVAAIDYRCRRKIIDYYAKGGDNMTWGEQPADAAILRSYIKGQHRAMQAVLDEIRVEDAAFAEAAAQELANLTVFREFGMAFDGWVRVSGAGGNVERTKAAE